jgi:hypothetical protein
MRARVCDGQRALPRHGARRRGVALSRHGKGILTYNASLAAASVEVLEDRRPRRAVQHRPRQLQGRPDRRARRVPRHHRQAWQMRPPSRGYVEARSPIRPTRRQSTSATCPTRPAGDRRRAALRPPALCRTGPRLLLRRRDRAGGGGRQRRRTARLGAAKGLDGLSRDLHLKDGATKWA